MTVPMIVQVDFIPHDKLNMAHVAEKTARANGVFNPNNSAKDIENLKFATQMTLNDYENFPHPADRLAYDIGIGLDMYEPGHSTPRWPDELLLAKAVIPKLRSSNEELRKEAFRDIYLLQKQYRAEWMALNTTYPHSEHHHGYGMCNCEPVEFFPDATAAPIDNTDVEEGCILTVEDALEMAVQIYVPIYRAGYIDGFADVKIREVPEDKQLRQLYWSLGWMEHMSTPGAKLVLNGKSQKYPAESMKTCQEEVVALKSLIAERKRELGY